MYYRHFITNLSLLPSYRDYATDPEMNETDV